MAILCTKDEGEGWHDLADHRSASPRRICRAQHNEERSPALPDWRQVGQGGLTSLGRPTHLLL